MHYYTHTICHQIATGIDNPNSTDKSLNDWLSISYSIVHDIKVSSLVYSIHRLDIKTRVFVDLETEAKPRFLNHEKPRVRLLTDLEDGS